MAKKEQVQNFLIPEHKKLSEEAIQSVLNEYSIKDTLKLPRIKKGDPALASLDVELGDVIEIERKSFAGRSKYYRVVVE